MADIGHNSGVSDRLRSFVERTERLMEERKALNDDIKEVLSEAKAVGFDVKIIRQIISLRKIEASIRREHEELLGVYKRALDMD